MVMNLHCIILYLRSCVILHHVTLLWMAMSLGGISYILLGRLFTLCVDFLYHVDDTFFYGHDMMHGWIRCDGTFIIMDGYVMGMAHCHMLTILDRCAFICLFDSLIAWRALPIHYYIVISWATFSDGRLIPWVDCMLGGYFNGGYTSCILLFSGGGPFSIVRGRFLFWVGRFHIMRGSPPFRCYFIPCWLGGGQKGRDGTILLFSWLFFMVLFDGFSFGPRYWPIVFHCSWNFYV